MEPMPMHGASNAVHLEFAQRPVMAESLRWYE